MDKNLTEIIIVLDRSGSMATIQKDMEGGLNSFFEEQKKEPGRAFVSLTQFDTEYEIVFSGVDLEEVPKVELHPRGGTALLDAVGRTINTVGERLSKTEEEKRPGRVILIIVTDGEENSSREFTSQQIAEMVKEQTETYNWQFVYIGANQDAFKEGFKLGIDVAANYVADSTGTQNMLDSMSKGVARYRSGGSYVDPSKSS